MARTKSNGTKDSTANLGFEAKLWLTADKLRNNMDAAECKPKDYARPGLDKHLDPEAFEFAHTVGGHRHSVLGGLHLARDAYGADGG